jgi:hypothetical protein
MSPEEKKVFEKNRAKFFETPNVDPVTNKSVRIGNFKPYQKLVDTYGEPPEKPKGVKSPKATTKKETKSIQSEEDQSKESKKKKQTKKDNYSKEEKSKEPKNKQSKKGGQSEEDASKGKKPKQPKKEVIEEVKPVENKIEEVIVKPKKGKKVVFEEPIKEVETPVVVQPTLMQEGLVSGEEAVEEPMTDINRAIALQGDIKKIERFIKDGTLKVNTAFWKDKFEVDHLPLLKTHKKDQDWIVEYIETEKAKKEAIKLVKVSMCLAKEAVFSLKMDIGSHLVEYLPKQVVKNAVNGGQVHILCLFNEDKWLGNYIDLTNKNWSMSFEEDNGDDTTIDVVGVVFEDVLSFLTVIEYQIMVKKELIQITTDDGVMLSRQDLFPQSKNDYPAVVAYRMADFDEKYI